MKLFDPNHPTLAVDLEMDVGPIKGLKMYGVGQQGTWGDVNTPRPGGFDFIEGLKWDAWNEVKGMPRLEARNRFIAIAKSILKKKGKNTIDPNKVIISQKYAECVQHKVAFGMSYD